MESTLNVSTTALNGDYLYNNISVLTFKIQYPVFQQVMFKKTTDKINKFYKSISDKYFTLVAGQYLTDSISAYEYNVVNNYSVAPNNVEQLYSITLNKNQILSVTYLRYEYMGGAHGNTVKFANTFDILKDKSVFLGNIIHVKNYKSYILNKILIQAKNNNQYENLDLKAIVKFFDEKNFYLTELGLVIFYELYTVGSYADGIVEFTFPYDNVIHYR